MTITTGERGAAPWRKWTNAEGISGQTNKHKGIDYGVNRVGGTEVPAGSRGLNGRELVMNVAVDGISRRNYVLVLDRTKQQA